MIDPITFLGGKYLVTIPSGSTDSTTLFPKAEFKPAKYQWGIPFIPVTIVVSFETKLAIFLAIAGREFAFTVTNKKSIFGKFFIKLYVKIKH